MFFGISEKLKSEERNFVVMLSAFLRHGGYSDGANAHNFAKNGNQENSRSAKNMYFCRLSTRKPWFSSEKLFDHSERGTSSLKTSKNEPERNRGKYSFFSAREAPNPKNIGLKRFFWNWTPKMQVFGAPNSENIGFEAF